MKLGQSRAGGRSVVVHRYATFAHREPMRTRIAIVVSSLFALLPAAFASADTADELIDRARYAAQADGGMGSEPLAIRSNKVKGSHSVRMNVKLHDGECIIAIAAGPDDVSDAQLSIRGAEGLWIDDNEPGSVAKIHYCASSDERVQFRARAAGGEKTLLAVGAWPLDATRARPRQAVSPVVITVSSATPAADAPAPVATPAPAAQALPERLESLAAKEASDLSAVSRAKSEHLKPGDSRARELGLNVAQCYRFLAVADDAVTNIVLKLHDAAGHEVAQSKSDGKTALLPATEPFCPRDVASYRLTMAIGGGEGEIVWQPYGGPNQAFLNRFPVGGDNPTDPLGKTMRAAQSTLGEGKPASTAFKRVTIPNGKWAEAVLDVQPGACYVPVATGGSEITDFDMQIADQRGTVVAQSLNQGNLARARACATEKARWHVRIRAREGEGTFGFQVFGGS
ncbi:MAG: hypothetical protein QM784_36765 [Polyangiaceae bacterium]